MSLIPKILKQSFFRFLHEEEGDGMKLSLATLVLSIMLVIYIIKYLINY